MPDYANPDPTLLEKLKSVSDADLAMFLENAKAKLPDARWFVDAIVTEQVNRGGFRNMTADSVREIILRYARRGECCTYKNISDELGIGWSQAHRRMPPILGQVSEMEHDCDRPLLTAIVVSQKGKCGGGFLEMAKRAGANFTNRERFQAEEQSKVFEYWREH
jgi:hypothetical protein